jgi:hypothetical protein
LPALIYFMNVIPEMRTANIQRGPDDNGGCLTILIIIGLIALFKMCAG